MDNERFFTTYSGDDDEPILTPEVEEAKNEYLELMSQLQQVAATIPQDVQEDISFENWVKENIDFRDSIFEENADNNDDIFWDDNSTYMDNHSDYSTSIAQQAIDLASQFVGTPYSWGGLSPKTGFDCSGIGYYAFRHFGINMPRTAKEMSKFGKEVPIDQVQKGDWIVTRSSGKSGHHVVWVTGRGPNGEIEVVNAKGSKDGIINDIFTNYKNIVSARRLNTTQPSYQSSGGHMSFEQALSEATKINPAVAKHKNFIRKIRKAETSNSKDPRIQNSAGAPYYGWFQMGREEIKATTGLTVEQFRIDPVQQILGATKLYELYLAEVKRIGAYGLCKSKGYSDDAIVAGAWLGGAGGVKKFIKGQGNPSDSKWYGGKGGTSVGRRMNEFNT